MPTSVAPVTLQDAAFVAASLAIMHTARRWMPLYALLVLPGTFLHELAHWLVGALSGARPTGLHMVPVRAADGRRWTLGGVAFRRVRWFSAVPIALAPLLLAPLALLLAAASLAMPMDDWRHWAGLYAATAAAVSSLPSRTDWTLALSRPLGALAYLVLVVAIAWLVLVRGAGG